MQEGCHVLGPMISTEKIHHYIESPQLPCECQYHSAPVLCVRRGEVWEIYPSSAVRHRQSRKSSPCQPTSKAILLTHQNDNFQRMRIFPEGHNEWPIVRESRGRVLPSPQPPVRFRIQCFLYDSKRLEVKREGALEKRRRKFSRKGSKDYIH